MEKIQVLVTDGFEKEGVDILRGAGFQVTESSSLPVETLLEIIPKYDVLVVRSATKVPAEVIQKGERLKIIGRAGVGLDNIDVSAATASGVIVMNAPEGNTISAAEHTIGLLLAIARNIPQANNSVKSGLWEKKRFMGTELYGKTLGVIGLGRIGRRVANLARGLGMKVLAHDPFVGQEAVKETEVSLVSLEGLLRQSDFITLHLPLTEKTRGLIGEKAFALMKEGASLINVARGGIVDEQALYQFLSQGKLRAAALDVFEKEPLPADSPLRNLENIILTPHLGASTHEAQVNVARDLASQIVDAFTRKIIRNAVNLPTLDQSSLEKLRGYLSVGEHLGCLVRQLAEGPIKSACIEYSGEITNYDLSFLRLYVLKGLFSDQPRVNVVNVSLLAKEQGLALSERRVSSAGEFLNLITVEVKGKKKVQAAGTLIQSREERIVQIDYYSVEATPQGVLLVCYNDDRPGIMGHIGTVLGKKGVNIASMTLGRKRKGGTAITVLNLDEEIGEDVLREIEAFPAIHSVKLVRL
ncbi:MAG: phosphoglycerate dehydrogenase [Candidatus Omnitrophica bacterium]|nr:phosphoglycerate dehydrogenase [Candidatus Omnitrophota bacterium]MCM8769054.1 phosphoglycerate dehydrogenase [Candidatus Omnitrophota bacterium]